MQVKGKVKVGEAMIEFSEGSGDAVVLIPGGGLDPTISPTSAGASHEGSDLDLSRRQPDTRMAQSQSAVGGALRGWRPGRTT
jgi:hypothetical protein